MPEETKSVPSPAAAKIAALQKTFNDSVKSAIGDDRHHGWGAEDSCEVIEALIAEEMPKGQAPSDALMGHIKALVNPSQFRQMLEKAKRPDGQTVLAETASKREKRTLALYS